MKGPVRWGVILGAGVAVLNLVFGLLGWHRAYEMAAVFLGIAILINLATVVLCLREGASSESWVGQIKNGQGLSARARPVSSRPTSAVPTSEHWAPPPSRMRQLQAGC